MEACTTLRYVGLNPCLWSLFLIEHLDFVYMAKLVFYKRHQKDKCHGEIGLRAQNVLTILGSTIDILDSTCVTM